LSLFSLDLIDEQLEVIFQPANKVFPNKMLG